MKILDVLTSPWSISPEKMAEIRNIYRAHLRGPKIDWKDMQASVALILGEDKPEEQYQVMNGIAVIPVKGVLTKGLSFFSFLFGGSSMKEIGMAFDAALNDPAVKAILLDVDSPGGTVDGTEELAQAIYDARGKGKPIWAYTDGMMASGAYWIASAADRIYISGDTVDVGSIGVVATHIDQSKADEAFGEKWTEITAGKYKRIASGHSPLTEEGAAYIQDQVDYIYSKFVDTVARNRDVNHESALAMADGKIFLGWQSVTVGLVDGVEAFSDLINSRTKTAGQPLSESAQEFSQKEEIMNIEELKSKYPDVYELAAAEGKAAGMAEGAAAGKAEGIEAGKTLGAEAERKRIAEVRAQLIPGHDALIDQLAGDGKTTGPEAAMAIVAAEKSVKAAALAALKEDGALGVAQPAAPAPGEEAAVDSNLPVEQRAKIAWDKDAKLRAEFGGNFDSYLAFEKHAGSIKILSRKNQN